MTWDTKVRGINSDDGDENEGDNDINLNHPLSPT